MKHLPQIIVISLLPLLGCQESTEPQQAVSYSQQVSPILQSHCLKCHNKEGEGYKVSGLNMETYASLMAGTKFGPIIDPGNSVGSTLVRVINAKTDPSIAMPHGGMQLLSEIDRKTIADWIDQGANDN